MSPCPVSQGDASFRYYEISAEKPYLNYLTDYRSLLPQKGMGKAPCYALYIWVTHTLFRKQL